MNMEDWQDAATAFGADQSPRLSPRAEDFENFDDEEDDDDADAEAHDVATAAAASAAAAAATAAAATAAAATAAAADSRDAAATADAGDLPSARERNRRITNGNMASGSEGHGRVLPGAGAADRSTPPPGSASVAAGADAAAAAATAGASDAAAGGDATPASNAPPTGLYLALGVAATHAAFPPSATPTTDDPGGGGVGCDPDGLEEPLAPPSPLTRRRSSSPEFYSTASPQRPATPAATSPSTSASELTSSASSPAVCWTGPDGTGVRLPTPTPTLPSTPTPPPPLESSWPPASASSRETSLEKDNKMTAEGSQTLATDQTSAEGGETSGGSLRSLELSAPFNGHAKGGSSGGGGQRSSGGRKKSAWYQMLNPTYRSRCEDFKRIFKELPADERLIVDYSCALQRDILLQGRIYVTQNFLCFYANIFRWETLVQLRWKDVTAVTKEKTALVIPNAVQINTEGEKHFFCSFGARDKTYVVLFRTWQQALLDQPLGNQELWKFVHSVYGEELGFSSHDEADADLPSALGGSEHRRHHHHRRQAPAPSSPSTSLHSAQTSNDDNDSVQQLQLHGRCHTHHHHRHHQQPTILNGAGGNGTPTASNRQQLIAASPSTPDDGGGGGGSSVGVGGGGGGAGGSSGGIGGGGGGGGSGGGGGGSGGGGVGVAGVAVGVGAAVASSDADAVGLTPSASAAEIADLHNLPTDMSDTTESEDERMLAMAEVVIPKCPVSHEGREVLNCELPMSVDELFTLLFANSSFYMDFLQTNRKGYDLVMSPWEESGSEKVRNVAYTFPLQNNLGVKSTRTSEVQTMLDVSRAGELYVVNTEATNSGIPYADTFYAAMHYCLVHCGRGQSRFTVHAQCKYRKSPFNIVKTFIERNFWSGIEDHFNQLKEALLAQQAIRDADQDQRSERCSELASSLQGSSVASASTHKSRHHGRPQRRRRAAIKDETGVETRRVSDSQVVARNVAAKPSVTLDRLAPSTSSQASSMGAVGSALLSTAVGAASSSGHAGGGVATPSSRLLNVVLVALVVLLCANGLLLTRLWALEELAQHLAASHESPPASPANLADLRVLTSRPQTVEEWTRLMRKQETAHRTAEARWRSALATVADVLRQSHESVAALERDLDPDTDPVRVILEQLHPLQHPFDHPPPTPPPQPPQHPPQHPLQHPPQHPLQHPPLHPAHSSKPTSVDVGS